MGLNRVFPGRLIRKLLRDDVTLTLARGGAVSLIFRFAGIAMMYLFTFLVARWCGSAGVGVFSISYIIIQIGALLAKSGSDTAILKFAADLSTRSEWPGLKRTLIKAYLLVVPLGLIISLLVYWKSDILAALLHKPDMVGNIRVVSLGFVPFSLLFVNAEFLRGLKKIGAYSVLENTLPFLIAVLALVWLYLSSGQNNSSVVSSFVISINICFLASLIILYYTTRPYIRWTGRDNKEDSKTDRVSWKYFLYVCTSLFVVGTISYMLGWVDTIVLSVYKTEAQVGIYNVCIRIATMTMVPLMAINSIAAPQFASAWAKNKTADLKQIAHKSTRMIFCLSLPVLLVMLIFPNFVLGLFGKEFLPGVVPLIILSFSQFINAVSGSTGLLLQMTDQYKVYQKIIFVSLILNVVLSLLLVPRFSIVGAAIGTSSGIILSNVLSVIFIKKHFGFWMIRINYKLR